MLTVRLDLTTVAELLLALKEPRRTLKDNPRNVFITPLDDKLTDVVLRLLDALSSAHEAQILGPALLREIHFRILTGDQGDAIRSNLGRGGHLCKIARALRRIHMEFNTKLSAEKLADEACMGLTAFHLDFKSVTGTTPLQYVKTLRLRTARVLMARDGISAAAASTRVGYESPSQFSREFKREFGRTPAQEIRHAATSNSAILPGETPAESSRMSKSARGNPQGLDALWRPSLPVPMRAQSPPESDVAAQSPDTCERQVVPEYD
jgi:AraC-like DNA-binding protein